MMTFAQLFAPATPAYLKQKRYQSLRQALVTTTALTTISLAPR